MYVYFLEIKYDLPKRTVLKYHPSWLRTVPKSSVPRTCPPIRKKTPMGASLMTQVVMVIIASAKLEKNSSKGLPFSPIVAKEIPRMIAKNTNPKMLDPSVHSPLNFQVRVSFGSLHWLESSR